MIVLEKILISNLYFIDPILVGTSLFVGSIFLSTYFWNSKKVSNDLNPSSSDLLSSTSHSSSNVVNVVTESESVKISTDESILSNGTEVILPLSESRLDSFIEMQIALNNNFSMKLGEEVNVMISKFEIVLNSFLNMNLNADLLCMLSTNADLMMQGINNLTPYFVLVSLNQALFFHLTEYLSSDVLSLVELIVSNLKQLSIFVFTYIKGLSLFYEKLTIKEVFCLTLTSYLYNVQATLISKIDYSSMFDCKVDDYLELFYSSFYVPFERFQESARICWVNRFEKNPQFSIPLNKDIFETVFSCSSIIQNLLANIKLDLVKLKELPLKKKEVLSFYFLKISGVVSFNFFIKKLKKQILFYKKN